MTKPKNGNHLIARNDELDKKMEEHPDIKKNVEALFAIGQRNRRLIKLLYVSLVVEAIMFGAIVYLATQAATAKNKAESTHISLVASCNAGNDFRKDNLALWAYVLNVPPQQPPTEAQKKIANDFKGFVSKTFELRDCNKIE